MSTAEAPGPRLGLRERKNRRTRLAIVGAAVELTLAGGFASATIPRIAELADVSPRTVSTWFPAKDQIIFERTDQHIVRAIKHLHDGAGDVVDRLKAWIDEEMSLADPDPEIARLRRAAIEHDPELRARDRQHFEQVQAEVARAAAAAVEGAAEAMDPQIFAGAAMAFLWKIGSMGLENDPKDVERHLEEGYALLRVTLGSIRPSVS